MLKVVIDTNLLIDASDDFYNYASRIIDLAIAGNIEPFANRATLRENILLAKRKIQDEGFLRKLEYFFEIVKPAESKRLNSVKDDPEDNKILESAVGAKADFVITSDKHLLVMEKFQGVKIVTPAGFWQSWEEDSDRGWMRWLHNFVK